MKPLAAIALLVVLTDTGQQREGLPVFVRHPQSAQIASQLDRGLTAELIRVYSLLQVRQQRASGRPVDPAYLLLSDRQGGFAKYGFWLGAQKKPDAAYIDVHRSWAITGQFGAIDQIFPHELAHAILHRLGVEAPQSGGANQVHAVGVRTDRFTAFNEGFAEHFQIMAVDHPGAAPKTRALASARDLEAAAWSHLRAYRHEMTARFAPASRMRLGFPLWYSNDERVLRYFAVKQNRFAREVRLPEALPLERAYLLENVLPGDGGMKTVPRLIASEGAVSALFHRWATDATLQNNRRENAFYEQVGTTSDAVSPLQNVYLKLFAAIESRRTADVVAAVNTYREMFPDEAAAADRVVADAFGRQPLIAPHEIWLANRDLMTGTTLFDQFRGAPRVHTFDLNAASMVDLMSVRGVTPGIARSIMSGAPYASLDALGRVPGVTADLVARMKVMAGEMEKLKAADEEKLTLRPILMPYLWRAGLALLVAGIIAALLHRFARIRAGARPSVVRSALAGLGAAFIGVVASWISGHALVATAAVAIVFGIPAAAWQLYRSRRLSAAWIALLIWSITALPAALVTTAL